MAKEYSREDSWPKEQFSQKIPWSHCWAYWGQGIFYSTAMLNETCTKPPGRPGTENLGNIWRVRVQGNKFLNKLVDKNTSLYLFINLLYSCQLILPRGFKEKKNHNSYENTNFPRVSFSFQIQLRILFYVNFSPKKLY